jgi:ankyrin repeat protein
MMLNDPAKRLFDAAKKGDIGAIRSALAEGASPDATTGKTTTTPLMIAAEKGRTLAVQYLLDAGANPNLATRQGTTALHKAIAKGQFEAVELLLERGADPRVEDGRGLIPVQEACFAFVGDKAVEIVRMILERGSPTSSPNGVWSGLRDAIRRGNPPLAALFLEYGASPDEKPAGPGARAVPSAREMLTDYLRDDSLARFHNSGLQELWAIERLFAEWDAKKSARDGIREP